MNALPSAVRFPAEIQASLPDGIVTLDVEGDAYFCLYSPDQTPASALPVCGPHGHDLPAGDPALDFGSMVALLLSLTRTLLDMRRCTFAELLRRAARTATRVGSAPFDTSRYSHAVAQFERFGLYMPFRFRCLFRAYWLIHFLARRDLPAQWVFGAALFPFEAHCWVACEGYLVGEHRARLEGLCVLLTLPSPQS